MHCAWITRGIECERCHFALGGVLHRDGLITDADSRRIPCPVSKEKVACSWVKLRVEAARVGAVAFRGRFLIAGPQEARHVLDGGD